MKKLFLAAGLLLAATSFTGYNSANAAVIVKAGGKHIPASQVPAPVLATFSSTFPTATNVKWQVEREHGQVVYQADFVQNGQRWRAQFSADGTLLSAGPR